MADLSDLSQGTLRDLESTLTGFERRPTQEEFVELWASAIERHRDVAIEAPTGSGKSFGYLVPAVQSGKRVVVATRSIALQNQLIHKDLPTLNRVLPTSWALAKGYGNFACKLKLGERTRSLPLEPTAVEALEGWAQTTEAGERDEAFSRLAPELGTQATREAWRSIQASPDDCIKAHCAFYEDCFYFRHRAYWDQAQVIVCNHHLLLYGLITSLLPPAELLVIDEAHALGDAAMNVLASRVSTAGLQRQLATLARSEGTRSEGLLSGNPHAIQDIDGLKLQIREAWEWIAAEAERDGSTVLLDETQGTRFEEGLSRLARHCEEAADVARDAACEEGLLDRQLEVLVDPGPDAQRALALKALIQEFQGHAQTLARAIESDPDHVAWLETADNPTLQRTPLYPGEWLAERLYVRHEATLLTSATLMDGSDDGLELIRRMTGFSGKARTLPPVFDPSASRLVVHDLTPPGGGQRTDAYQDRLGDELREIVAEPGHHLVLFTARRDLEAAAKRLRDRLPEGCRLLCQGELGRDELVRQFRETDHVALFGLESFWIGFDCAGMKTVTIVRLPFEVPSHPIEQARVAAIEAEGGNAFRDYLLPKAVLRFRQGAGRLIRRHDDDGDLHVLDDRIVTKPYGRTFRESLDGMALVRADSASSA